MLVIVRVEGEEVVDVAADDQGLLARAARRLNGFAPGEHALGGDEAMAKEVGEESALPAPPRLCHAVGGFLDAQHPSVSAPDGLNASSPVAYPEGMEQYTTSFSSSLPCRKAATKSQRRIWSFSLAAREESIRSDEER